MIKPINHDQAILAQTAKIATAADQQVVTDLLDTLAAHRDECVGMAANMIGINKSIIVVQMGMIAIPMINPTITKKSIPTTEVEGCLSITGQKAVQRYHQITVKYLDRNFEPHEQEFSDWIAQIIQHEVDHCHGILV